MSFGSALILFRLLDHAACVLLVQLRMTGVWRQDLRAASAPLNCERPDDTKVMAGRSQRSWFHLTCLPKAGQEG